LDPETVAGTGSRLVAQQPRCRYLVGHVGEHPLQALKLANRMTELLAPLERPSATVAATRSSTNPIVFATALKVVGRAFPNEAVHQSAMQLVV
jgi:hypothetical protein